VEAPELAAENENKLEVTILDEREITTHPKLGETAVTVVLTYSYADMAPRSLFIPKTEDTPENRSKLIREDIEKAKAAKPKTLTV